MAGFVDGRALGAPDGSITGTAEGESEGVTDGNSEGVSEGAVLVQITQGETVTEVTSTLNG